MAEPGLTKRIKPAHLIVLVAFLLLAALLAGVLLSRRNPRRELSGQPGVFAIQVDESSAAYMLHNQAVRSLEEGDYRQAEQIYRQVIQVEPQAPSGYVALASSLLLQDKLDEAEQFYLQALEIDPQSVFGLIGLGSVALKRGDDAAARDYYARALEMEPDQPDAHWGMALASQGLHHPDQALEHLRRFLELAPRSSLAATAEQMIAEIEAGGRQP